MYAFSAVAGSERKTYKLLSVAVTRNCLVHDSSALTVADPKHNDHIGDCAVQSVVHTLYLSCMLMHSQCTTCYGSGGDSPSSGEKAGDSEWELPSGQSPDLHS